MTSTTTQFENAQDALRQAPDLLEHIVSLIPIKQKPGGDDEVRSKRVHPPMPFNESAFSDADELYGRLAHWSAFWASRIGSIAPDPVARARRSSWTVVGLPVGIEPHEAREAMQPMAAWLLANLEEIFRRPADDVAYFLSELNEIHQAAARYPAAATPHWSNLTCRLPGCSGRVALYPFTEVKTWTEKGRQVYLPPEGARVLCVECNDQWTQAEYQDEVDRRVVAAKEQRRGDKTRMRLLRKYGTPQSAFPKFTGTVAGKVRHDQSTTGWERDPQ